eukprot:8606482-Heterocapsa_arctica.AAC.1
MSLDLRVGDRAEGVHIGGLGTRERRVPSQHVVGLRVQVDDLEVVVGGQHDPTVRRDTEHGEALKP